MAEAKIIEKDWREVLMRLSHYANRALKRLIAKVETWRIDWKIRRASRIIIGAGGTAYPNWVSTEKTSLDVTKVKNFEKYWTPDSLTALLAEHVWEHLSNVERYNANQNCFNFLKPGGWLRIAVPDGFHPDPNYIEYVRPGGCGLGATDHQVLFDYRSLSLELESVGFKVELLEYWNEAGEFNREDWRVEDGYVYRSIRFDQRNQDGLPEYTSLIVDAKKPV